MFGDEATSDSEFMEMLLAEAALPPKPEDPPVGWVYQAQEFGIEVPANVVHLTPTYVQWVVEASGMVFEQKPLFYTQPHLAYRVPRQICGGGGAVDCVVCGRKIASGGLRVVGCGKVEHASHLECWASMEMMTVSPVRCVASHRDACVGACKGSVCVQLMLEDKRNIDADVVRRLGASSRISQVVGNHRAWAGFSSSEWVWNMPPEDLIMDGLFEKCNEAPCVVCGHKVPNDASYPRTHDGHRAHRECWGYYCEVRMRLGEFDAKCPCEIGF